MAKRGRPKKNTIEDNKPPRKFTRKFTNVKTGIKSIWTYDLNISTKGPISIEEIYPKDYIDHEDGNLSLPKTKRTYFNNKSGKEVSYQRAKQLGII